MARKRALTPFVRKASYQGRGTLLISVDALSLLCQCEGNVVAISLSKDRSKLLIEPFTVPVNSIMRAVHNRGPENGAARVCLTNELVSQMPEGRLPAVWNDVAGRLEISITK